MFGLPLSRARNKTAVPIQPARSTSGDRVPWQLFPPLPLVLHAICAVLILGKLIRIPFHRNRVLFVEPAAQVDKAAPFRTKGHRAALFGIKDFLANGTANLRHRFPASVLQRHPSMPRRARRGQGDRSAPGICTLTSPCRRCSSFGWFCFWVSRCRHPMSRPSQRQQPFCTNRSDNPFGRTPIP